MKFIASLTKLNFIYLKRRLFLLFAAAAALVMLCIPFSIGMQSVFARSDMDNLQIAIVGENGEGETLADFAGRFRDIAAYCRFIATDRDTAMAMLEQGKVTAVLELPDHFVNSILIGDNAPVQLHVDAGRPTESLLTIYVAQCAADMLSAAQGGIYAVLDAMDAANTRQENSLLDINLEYIRRTLNRSNFYTQEEIMVTGNIPIETHYAQSLLIWLLLMSGIVFYPILNPRVCNWQQRLKCIGYTQWHWAISSMLPVCLLQLSISILICLFAGNFHIFCVLALALFASGLTCLTGTLCNSESSCTVVSFAINTMITYLFGGIVPVLLMPKLVRTSFLYEASYSLLRCVRGEICILPIIAGTCCWIAAFLRLAQSYKKES